MISRSVAATRLGLVGLVIAATLMSACSSMDTAGEVTAPPPTVVAAVNPGQPDHPIAGPQGRDGQFVVQCDYSHASFDDPIVYPVSYTHLTLPTIYSV